LPPPLEPRRAEVAAAPPAPPLDELARQPKRGRPSYRVEPSEDHDIRTRFDDQAHRFIAEMQPLGEAEVDESDLPSVEDLRPDGVPASALKTAEEPLEEIVELEEDEAPLTAPRPKMPETVRTQPSAPIALRTPEPEPDESPMEDDLDEADFFVQQRLFDEARAILEGLLERHPGHPLVSAKLRDLEAMAAAGPVEPAAEEPLSAGEADLSAELPTDLPGKAAADEATATGLSEEVYEMTRRGVIEKGVTAEDFETHYDLGIAYKEMGLIDDAIAEFKLVMKDPAREVQCHLMIGLCLMEKGMQTEAIGHFKKGLYVEGISEREAMSLYFELGQAYERLGDPREALYYYEKVMKRDPRFRGVERVVQNLRGGAAPDEKPKERGPANRDDVDAAFDALLDN
jgi:tetratricopeptide (TPR) repeat protein